MEIFEEARIRAHRIAPLPDDKPLTSAITTFGFGIMVVAIFVALQWCGLSFWLSWLTAAMAYGAIAYADCLLAWNRNKSAFHDALADLKALTSDRSVH